MIFVQLVTEEWNPVSAAIRYTTRSWCSHAEFYDTDNKITLGSRSHGGVKIRPSKDRYTKIERFTAIGIDDAFEWAKTQIGKSYDYSAIAGILFNRNWRDGKRWFCSELISAAFEEIGHPLLAVRETVDVWRVTPRDLLLSLNLKRGSNEL